MRSYVFIITAMIYIGVMPAGFSFAQTSPAQVQTEQISSSTPSLDTQLLIKQLQSLVESLQKQILDLQTQLKAAKGDIAEVKIEIKELKLSRSVSIGAKGDDIRELQEVLKQDPEIYPEGLVTGFFGHATEAAIKRFQEKHGIESIGIVGPKTLAKLQELASKRAEHFLRDIIPAKGENEQKDNISSMFSLAPSSSSTSTATTTLSGKLIICHIPPGNPKNKQTIEIDQSALPAHIAHGDSVSACVTTTPIPIPPSTAITTPPVSPSLTSTTTIATSTAPVPSSGVTPPTTTPPPSTGTSTTTTAPTTSSSPLTSPTPPPSPSPSTGGTSTTTTATSTTATDTIAPSVPTNLTATVVSSNQINLSWTASTDNVGVTGYKIYRGGTQIATITAGTQHSDTGLTAAASYSYTIAAYDAAGNVSAQSSQVSATTVAESPPPSTNSFAWIRQSGGVGNDEFRGVVVDNSGNPIVAGSTRPGAALSYTPSALLTKYDVSGNQLWTNSLVGSSSTLFNGLAADSSGTLYAAGYTYGAVDENVFSGGGGDGLLVSYDSQGTKRWVRFVGGTGSEWLHSVAADSSGSVYAVGYTTSSIDGIPYAGGSEDGLIVKYDNAGNRVWTRLLGTSGWDILYGVTTDLSGNVYVAGYSTGSFANQPNAGGYSDMLIAKYDGSGNQLWVRMMGGSSGVDEFHSVTADDAGGAVYAVGYTSSPLVDSQTSNGGQDGVIVKYGADGNRSWTRLFGETRSDAFLAVAYKGGNVYAGGIQSIGNLWDTEDGVIVTYDSSGNKIKSTIISSQYKIDAVIGMTVDSAANVYGAGSTAGALYDQTSKGGTDSFIVKYNQGVLADAFGNIIRNLATALSALENFLKSLR